MFSGVDKILACDGRTDRQTSCNNIGHAMHTHCVVKTIIPHIQELICLTTKCPVKFASQTNTVVQKHTQN